jgi:hypothetical protein
MENKKKSPKGSVTHETILVPEKIGEQFFQMSCLQIQMSEFIWDDTFVQNNPFYWIIKKSTGKASGRNQGY